MNTCLLVLKGSLVITSNQRQQYESDDCQSFIEEIGSFILESNEKNPTKDFKILFFPTGVNNILNLQRKQNVSFCGEPMIGPLFFIEYDKDSQFKFFKKCENKICTKLHFMIIQ